MKANSNCRFDDGIHLFNEGDFFRAHEAWEDVWKKADGEEKTFYQGIIQVAAALVHIQRGNHKGAISLYLKSRPKLDRFPGVWMGIDLEHFRDQLSHYFKQLETSFGQEGESFPPTIGRSTTPGHPPKIRQTSPAR